jgi:hypothetical protein
VEVATIVCGSETAQALMKEDAPPEVTRFLVDSPLLDELERCLPGLGRCSFAGGGRKG